VHGGALRWHPFEATALAAIVSRTQWYDCLQANQLP
jgi:hypothetical protein